MFIYTVRPGDTIYKLAALFNTPINAIMDVNPGLYPYDLLIGQRIMIPTATDPVQDSRIPAAPSVSMDNMYLRYMAGQSYDEHAFYPYP